MKLYEVQERTGTLLNALLETWEASVRATHLFLSNEEISHIKTYVPQALAAVPHLVVAERTPGVPVGFLGVAGDRLEMLFLAPSERGQGTGRQLLQYGVQQLGFVTYQRTDQDEQGDPYPLLYMRLP